MRKIYFGLVGAVFLGLVLGLVVFFNPSIVSNVVLRVDAPLRDQTGGYATSTLGARPLSASTTPLSEIKHEVISPKPLVTASAKSNVPPAATGSAEILISRAGIVNWTNINRVKNGLPPLLSNSYLDTSAEAKAKDILARQYFAHVSPDGKGAGDLVTEAGYSYILVGENLALGGFDSNKEIVDAWMASTGHRENILNKRFWEIGVGVVSGIYEGQEVWVAVQHFGLPLSACSQPDAELLTQIESHRNLIAELSKQADAARAEIQAFEPKDTPEYNAKVDAYNALVRQVNDLIDELRGWIDTYNEQVRQTNQCMAG